MFELSQSALAFLKLLAIFGGILAALRFHRPLWQAIGAGALLLMVVSAMAPAQGFATLAGTLMQSDFVIMEVMILGILLLSAIQGATGQSRRLVDGLDRYLRWPRLRLVVFPALVGLLPMPGGALFSCPMLDAAAHGMEVSPQRKALINYWFRHIWELAWPLYPGYVLVSSLLGLPLLELIKYTGPLVLFSFLTGWFFFIRDIRVDSAAAAPRPSEDSAAHHARTVLYEALPLIITIVGAGVFGALFSHFAPAIPAPMAFIASLAVALAVALIQGRGHFEAPLHTLIFTKSMSGMLLLIYVIYAFKNLIGVSGIVEELSHVGNDPLLVCLLFALMPLACGILTGIMVGYVGACFPILLGILAESGLHEYTLPLIIVAVICGNIGQLITPLHICVVVTCEYYRVRFTEMWRDLLAPLATQFAYGVSWALLLYALGARF